MGSLLLTAWLLTACGGQDTSSEFCGWDLTTDAGRAASQERLTFTSQWLIDHPGVPAPAPTSSYWRGECPTPETSPLPPEDEDEHPDDLGPSAP